MWAFSGLLVMALLPDVRLACLQPKSLRGIAVWLVSGEYFYGALYELLALNCAPVRGVWIGLLPLSHNRLSKHGDAQHLSLGYGGW